MFRHAGYDRDVDLGISVGPRVHSKGREANAKLAIRLYNNSSESNMTSCLAHMTTPSAKSLKFLLTILL